MGILSDVKKVLGVPAEVEAFNTELLIDVNAVADILRQLGCRMGEGPITDVTEWDYVRDGKPLWLIQAFFYLKTRLMFDPPTIGHNLTSMQNVVAEYEWRISTYVDEGD